MDFSPPESVQKTPQNARKRTYGVTRRITRLPDKLEIHYTPKQGSWPSMAAAGLRPPPQIEFSVVGKRLPGRVPDAERLVAHCDAITEERNDRGATANWQFTAANARINLQWLYPSLQLR